MGVNIKTVKDDFPKMEKSLKVLSKRKVNVGHLDGGEQAWLAAIHEYGCIITVTDKMRAWLHRNGLHLKSTTTTITIPPRPFLAPGYDKYRKQVVMLNEEALGECLINGDIDTFLENVGQMLRDKIVDYAVDLKTPPKHPFSLEMNPGKTNPLIISGDMIEALTFEVK